MKYNQAFGLGGRRHRKVERELGYEPRFETRAGVDEYIETLRHYLSAS